MRLSEKHIPELDGIRGIAILMVVLYHSRVIFLDSPRPPGLILRMMTIGWSGVDLFFVLSGFLITGILLDTRDSPRYFKRFYARRVLRIFPLYFAYLLFILVVLRSICSATGIGDPWSQTRKLAYVAYLSNLMPGTGASDPLLPHIWSLCVEEQFYLIWPSLIYFIRPKFLPSLCIATIVASPLIRLAMYAEGINGYTISRVTFTRLDTLALGALVAIALRRWPQALRAWSLPVAMIAFLGIIGVLFSARTNNWDTPAIGIWGASLLAVFYAGIIGFAVTSGLLNFLAAPFLAAIGRKSYAIYVLHVVPLWFTTGLWSSLAISLKLLYFPWLLAVSFILAQFSWVLLERRCLALRRIFG